MSEQSLTEQTSNDAAGMQLKDLRVRAKEAGVKGRSKRRLYTKHNKGELLKATIKAEEVRAAKLEERRGNGEVVFYGSVADSYLPRDSSEGSSENSGYPWMILVVSTTIAAVGFLGWVSSLKNNKSPNIKNENESTIIPIIYSNEF